MSVVPLYQLQAIRRGYGRSFQLELEALDIAPGETLCLLGPTGSGKSTLLRLLGGIDPPDAGTIHFDGRRDAPIDWPLDVRRRVTMVYQRPLLLDGSVRENIEYGLRLRRRSVVPRDVDTLLERLGLRDLASQPAPTLSGGQTQLVALARALIIEPDVLLLDEPTSHLDPASVGRVEALIADVRTERPLTIVWATHNLFQARRVASRVGWLLSGKLVEIAETRQFFEAPHDARTADFVQGKMVY